MWPEPSKKLARYIAISFVFIAIVTSARDCYWYYTLPTNCYHQEREKNVELHGLVTNKFIDSHNHNFHAIVLGHNFFENKVYIDETEDSILWKEIRVNDSVVKQKNSLTYYLIRKNQKIAITVKFDCKN